MIKHKAKAERAAARQAKALLVPVDLPDVVPASVEATEHGDNGGLDGILPGVITRGSSPIGSDGPSTDAKTTALSASALAAAARLELLRGKSDLLLRFMRLIIPVLVEVYAASVAVNIRTRALTGILKAASFLEPDELWKAVEVCYSHSQTYGSLTSPRSARSSCEFHWINSLIA
jgi:E3 ubiquitin-protein ligase TRIP12